MEGAKMNRIQRMISNVLVSLSVFALISAISIYTSVAAAEPAGTLSIDSAVIRSTSSNIPMPWPIWSLGIVLIAVAIITGRKAG